MNKHGLRWQENFHEHRLRTNERLLPFFHYIFMNPYRKKLIPGDQTWLGFKCCATDWEWFQHHLKDDSPYPEWLSGL